MENKNQTQLYAETHIKFKDTDRPKVKVWEKIHANVNQKRVGVSIFISNKIDFNVKIVKRDKKVII